MNGQKGWCFRPPARHATSDGRRRRGRRAPPRSRRVIRGEFALARSHRLSVRRALSWGEHRGCNPPVHRAQATPSSIWSYPEPPQELLFPLVDRLASESQFPGEVVLGAAIPEDLANQPQLALVERLEDRLQPFQ
jgi:hypothetical protein